MYSRINPARLDREDEKRMLPCRYFLSGFCHKGNRCKFYHPSLNTRDPIIRPPELPVDFTTPLQYKNGPRVSNSRSRIFNTHQTSPITRGGSTPSPRSSSVGLKDFMSPQSQSYSEYLQYTHQQRNNPLGRGRERVDREDIFDDERNISPVDKKSKQNTVFDHIDWSEFLAPGVNPPLPIQVSDQATPLSPDVSESGLALSYIWRPSDADLARVQRAILRVNNEDVPPEGSNVGIGIKMPGHGVSSNLLSPGQTGPRKLSAKEELQLKVKQIAQELSEEPVQHVRSLDSFFRNFKFNGFACPNSPATEKGSVNGDEMEIENIGAENKETLIQIEVEAEKVNAAEDVGVIATEENMEKMCIVEIGESSSSIEGRLSPPSILQQN